MTSIATILFILLFGTQPAEPTHAGLLQPIGLIVITCIAPVCMENLGLKRHNAKVLLDTPHVESANSWVLPHDLKAVHFRKLGQIVGTVNYGHLVLNFDLHHLDGHVGTLCSFPSTLDFWARKRFDNLGPHKKNLANFRRSLITKCQVVRTAYFDMKRIWLHDYHKDFSDAPVHGSDMPRRRASWKNDGIPGLQPLDGVDPMTPRVRVRTLPSRKVSARASGRARPSAKQRMKPTYEYEYAQDYDGSSGSDYHQHSEQPLAQNAPGQYDYNDLQYHENSLGNDTVVRKPRQVIIAAMAITAAVSAVSSFLFSTQQLVDFTEESGPDEDTKAILQKHNDQITIINDVIDELNRTQRDLIALGHRFKHDSEPWELQLYYLRLSEAGSSLQWEIERLSDGLQALTKHALSPKLIPTSALAYSYSQLKVKLNLAGLIPLVSDLEDLYRCSTSHILYDNGSISILVHVPAYREDTLLELYRFIPAPIDLTTLPDGGHSNSNHLWIPRPEGELLAVSPSRRLFRTINENDFSLCKTLGSVYYCSHGNYYDRRIKDSCLVNLFLNQDDNIRKSCEWAPEPRASHLSQLSANDFVLYQTSKGVVEKHCGSHATSVAYEGVRRLKIGPGCRAISKDFVFDGAINVFLAPDKVVTHWISLVPEDIDIPDDHAVAELLDQLGSTGRKRALTFQQLSDTYWLHRKRKAHWFMAISVIIFILVAVFIGCYCYLFPNGCCFRSCVAGLTKLRGSLNKQHIPVPTIDLENEDDMTKVEEMIAMNNASLNARLSALQAKDTHDPLAPTAPAQ